MGFGRKQGHRCVAILLASLILQGITPDCRNLSSPALLQMLCPLAEGAGLTDEDAVGEICVPDLPGGRIRSIRAWFGAFAILHAWTQTAGDALRAPWQGAVLARKARSIAVRSPMDLVSRLIC